MEAVKVVIAIGNGWQGLYAKDKLETEGDRINHHDFVVLINKYKIFEGVEIREISDDCLDEIAGCPLLLDDVY